MNKRPESGIKRPDSGVNRPMSKGIMKISGRREEIISGEEDAFRELLDAGKFEKALEFIKKIPDGL